MSNKILIPLRYRLLNWLLSFLTSPPTEEVVCPTCGWRGHQVVDMESAMGGFCPKCHK